MIAPSDEFFVSPFLRLSPNYPIPMNKKLALTLTVACLTLGTFCLLNPVHAAQPAMHKAIELLEQAKTAQNPAALLEQAKERVASSERGERGGRRFAAINKIEKAIAAVNSGSDARSLIDEAIVLVREGMEIKRENKGKKKGE